MNLDYRLGAGALAAAGLTACTAILGIGGDYTEQGQGGATSASSSSTTSTSTNAGGGGSSSASVGGSGGGCVATDVTGFAHSTYIKAMGQVPSDEDLSKESISAYSPKPNNGGYDVKTGSGTKGMFTIPGVPCGPYYLAIGTDFFYTDNRMPDVGRAIMGRPDVVAASAATTLVFDVTNMNAWTQSDAMEMISINGNVYAFGLEQIVDTPPAIGATSFTGTAPYIAAAFFDPNLLVSDPLAMPHLQPKTGSNGTNALIATESAQLGQTTFVDGAANMVNGAFMPLPQNHIITFDVKTTQFEALAKAVSPNAVINNELVAVDSLAGPTDGKYGFYTATVDSVLVSPNAGVDLADVFAYGDPMLAMHAEMGVVQVFSRLPWKLAGAKQTGLGAGPIHFDLLSTFDGKPIAPLIQPPAKPTIDAGDFHADGPLASLTPVVAWTAPAGTAPTRYQLAIWELFVGGNNFTTGRVAARIHTTQTSVQIPPGLLKKGQPYGFILFSLYMPHTDVNSSVRAQSFPLAGSPVASGVKTP